MTLSEERLREAEEARVRISHALYGEGNDPGHPLHAVTDALIAVASAKFKRPEPLFAFRDVVENGDGTANLVSLRSDAHTSGEVKVDCADEGHDHPNHDWRTACLKCGVFKGSDLHASLGHPIQGEAEPVAWVTSDILAAMKRGDRVVAGWKQSADFCIPLFASHPPAAAGLREITDEIEAAARALCAVKGINPDAAHYGTSDRDVQDGTFPDGKPFYFGWRNQVKYVDAVVAALAAAKGAGEC